MNRQIIQRAAFVVRCAAGATVAWEMASALALPEPGWAAISALIVSQERLQETQSTLKGRLLGTLLGIAVTIVVNEVASRVAGVIAVQIAVAVAICAFITLDRPKLRVAMWTCPIILLTAQSSEPIVTVALQRCSEVILGAMVGAGLHWGAQSMVEARPVSATPRAVDHAAHGDVQFVARRFAAQESLGPEHHVDREPLRRGLRRCRVLAQVARLVMTTP